MKKRPHKWIGLAFVILVVFLFCFVIWWKLAPHPQGSMLPIFDLRSDKSQQSKIPQIVAQNLDVPWDFVFLPDGEILITLRNGQVIFIDKNGVQQEKPILTVSSITEIEGEGGLLGIALHPDFKGENGKVYLYYTYKDGNKSFNKVVEYSHAIIKLAVVCADDKDDCKSETHMLRDPKVVIDKIPANGFHDGGRISFGPDKKLYITTGDAQNEKLSQDVSSLAGKILRINPDGSIPEDNPFPSSPVYSYGHRNPQGLAWSSDGRMFATEHGSSAHDEINIIEKGVNYGWPNIRGDETNDGMQNAFVNSGKETWAPSGATILKDKLYFSGLRGRAIYSLDIGLSYKTVVSDKVVKDYFINEYGRIRTIKVGPDGDFYIITNNRDGRGIPGKDDDKLIRIPAIMLQ